MSLVYQLNYSLLMAPPLITMTLMVGGVQWRDWVHQSTFFVEWDEVSLKANGGRVMCNYGNDFYNRHFYSDNGVVYRL
uniref:Uncharacterized protein n=1 Tax=Rhodnius prolixus TaxID=13249 RepID=T1HY05_RHOPR